MNWDAIGAVGQVLGSVAVFITLGYLAVQVRHANYELRRSISQDRGEAVRELLRARAMDAELAEIVVRTHEALGDQPYPFMATVMQKAGLNLTEAFRLYSDQTAWFNFHTQVFQYMNEMSSTDRALFENGTRRFYASGLGRVYLDTTIRSAAHPDFVRYVDSLLAQSG